MVRSLILAGLLIDSWRDQSPQTKSSEMNLQDSTTPISRFRGTPDDSTAAPRLASLIALGAIKRGSR
jgi:hypothetical protein